LYCYDLKFVLAVTTIVDLKENYSTGVHVGAMNAMIVSVVDVALVICYWFMDF